MLREYPEAGNDSILPNPPFLIINIILQAQSMLYSYNSETEKASLNNQWFNIAITAYRNLLDETAEAT
jgi:hypothetical protein